MLRFFSLEPLQLDITVHHGIKDALHPSGLSARALALHALDISRAPPPEQDLHLIIPQVPSFLIGLLNVILTACLEAECSLGEPAGR